MRRVIAVDFDGTCVTHAYPDLGEEIGAPPVLRKIVAAGFSLILYTMRAGEELKAAQDWFARNEIPLWASNENPEQASWTKSPKVYAQLYIDDAALGAPLIYPPLSSRPYIDWPAVERMLGLSSEQEILGRLGA